MSQLVRVSVASRSGWRAAKIWAMAPPVSLATRSIPVSPSASQKSSKAGRQRGQGQILLLGDRTAAVQREVDRDAAALAGQRADDVAPQVGVGGDAVYEQRHGSGADVDITDLAGAGRGGVPVGAEFGKLHYARPFQETRYSY